MDIKSQRRDVQPVEGNYEDHGRAQGSSASDNNVGWDVRAQSWQRGADTDKGAVCDEKGENDVRWGVPYADVLPNPAAGNKNVDVPLGNPHNFSNNPGFMGASASEATSSGAPTNGNNVMPSSGTGRSLRPVSREQAGSSQAGGGWAPGSTMSKQSNPTVGRSAALGHGNVALPAPGDTNPGAEGDPLQVTSGFNG